MESFMWTYQGPPKGEVGWPNSGDATVREPSCSLGAGDVSTTLSVAQAPLVAELYWSRG